MELGECLGESFDLLSVDQRGVRDLFVGLLGLLSYGGGGLTDLLELLLELDERLLHGLRLFLHRDERLLCNLGDLLVGDLRGDLSDLLLHLLRGLLLHLRILALLETLLDLRR